MILLCLSTSRFANNGLEEEIIAVLAEEGLAGVTWVLVTATGVLLPFCMVYVMYLTNHGALLPFWSHLT